jgi:hypothetical protein
MLICNYQGERLHWSSLKNQSAVQVTDDMLQSRRVSENEVQNKYPTHSGQITLLVLDF